MSPLIELVGKEVVLALGRWDAGVEEGRLAAVGTRAVEAGEDLMVVVVKEGAKEGFQEVAKREAQ